MPGRKVHSAGTGMTRMSRSCGAMWSRGHAKAAYRLGPAGVARVLLLFARTMSGALLVGALAAQPGWGCVLPPDLEPEGSDAGPSSPPVIVSALPADFAFPGPITVVREDITQILTLTVEDNDLGDSLYVKFYRDYVPITAPTPALVDCAEPGPSATRARTIDCRPVALCIGVPDTDEVLHVVEVMVSDQPFIADSEEEAFGQPTYRAVANVERAGHSLRAWSMTCGSSQ
jgi:hypothetical protein